MYILVVPYLFSKVLPHLSEQYEKKIIVCRTMCNGFTVFFISDGQPKSNIVLLFITLVMYVLVFKGLRCWDMLRFVN